MSFETYLAKTTVLLTFAATMLVSCKPPASDDAQQRGDVISGREGPMAPIESPETEDAVWATGNRAERLLYGKPGGSPLLALECTSEEDVRLIKITRFVAADAEAKALMALIGNGHAARLPVDAQWNGRVWLWEGSFRADDPDLSVFSGPRQIELTIPGAGSVVLNPSARPGRLLENCRQTEPKAPAP